MLSTYLAKMVSINEKMIEKAAREKKSLFFTPQFFTPQFFALKQWY